MLYLLNIRKDSNWLRVNYFGACFGEAFGLIACADNTGSEVVVVVATMDLKAGKVAASNSRVKYGENVQLLGLMPFKLWL